MFRFCPECEKDLELQPEELDVGIVGLYYCPKCEYTEEI
jgi:DNA-directed RNA polymerase subunit M/transcription elongation factor TFIIS